MQKRSTGTLYITMLILIQFIETLMDDDEDYVDTACSFLAATPLRRALALISARRAS